MMGTAKSGKARYNKGDRFTWLLSRYAGGGETTYEPASQINLKLPLLYIAGLESGQHALDGESNSITNQVALLSKICGGAAWFPQHHVLFC